MTYPRTTAFDESEQPQCEAIRCDALADWAFIGEGGDVYLCVFHGGKEPVESWVWIGTSRNRAVTREHTVLSSEGQAIQPSRGMCT